MHIPDAQRDEAHRHTDLLGDGTHTGRRHTLQALLLAVDAIIPRPHATHESALAPEKVPAGHASQLYGLTLDNAVPDAHATHRSGSILRKHTLSYSIGLSLKP